CLEYPARSGAPLRSGHRRGARLLPHRNRELARRAEPRRVKPVVRRRALLVAVGLLVAVLVGGLWLALETAGRAWGASLPGGGAGLPPADLRRYGPRAPAGPGLLLGPVALERAAPGARAGGGVLRHRGRRPAVRRDRLAAVPSLVAVRERARAGALGGAARVARADAHVGRRPRSRRNRRRTARGNHAPRARRASRRCDRPHGARRPGRRRQPRVGLAGKAAAARHGLGRTPRRVAIGIRRHSRLALDRRPA